MHRWFFATDEISCETPKEMSASQQSLDSATSSVLSITEKSWSFQVQFDGQLCANEFLAISGSCLSLGNWDVQASIPLRRDNSSSCWTLTVVLPRSGDIHYRYFVCAVDFRGRKFVRFWETHFEGRRISQNEFQNLDSMESEVFGLLNNQMKIERGWLETFVCMIQLKFYQAPYVLNSCGEKILLSVKITPIKLKIGTKCGALRDLPIGNEAESGEAFAFCEVALLQDQNGEFRKQSQYGTLCQPDYMLLFNITANALEQCAFLIDFYNIPAKSGPDVPPNHFGYQYFMARDFEDCGGTLERPLICATRHRPIGTFQCDHLVVKPMTPLCEQLNLEKTYQRYWNAKNQSLFCGHRGCGHSYWFQNNILRENCLKSFNLAIEHGADMVEFDVQLTKDMIPIIYHDSHLCISKNFELDLLENDILHLPLTNSEIKTLKSSAVKLDKEFWVIQLGKFTLEQLKRVKVYEPSRAESVRPACSSDPESNRPFITIEQALREINARTGFVVDIKWNQKFNEDTKPLPNVFDKNEYIDTILSVVIKNAGSRRIIFSSSDAEICTMVRLKQNLYPVMFQARPNGDLGTNIDPHRAVSFGVYFAHAMELWGVNIECENILHIPGNITGLHERGLSVFSWGIETRYEDKRKFLKSLGVDGVICDRLNHILKPLDLKLIFVYIIPVADNTEIININN